MPRTDLNSVQLSNKRKQLIRKKDGKGLFDLMYEVYSNSYDSRLKNDGKISNVDEKCEDTAENFLELIASTNKGNGEESEPSGEVHESRKDILKSFIDSLNEQYYLTVINLGEKRNMWEDRIKKGFFEETKYAQNDPEAVKKIAHNIVLSSETDAHSILEIKSRLLSSIAGKTIDGKSVEEYFRESDENARKKVMGTKKVSEKKLDKYIQDFENNKYYEEVGFKANGYEYEKGRPFFKEVPEVNPRLWAEKSSDEIDDFEKSQLDIIDKYETYISSANLVVQAAKQAKDELDEFEKKNSGNSILKNDNYIKMRKGITQLSAFDPVKTSAEELGEFGNLYDSANDVYHGQFSEKKKVPGLKEIAFKCQNLLTFTNRIDTTCPQIQISIGEKRGVKPKDYLKAKQNCIYIAEARRSKKLYDVNLDANKENAFSSTLKGQINRMTDSLVNDKYLESYHTKLISKMLKCERLYNRYWTVKNKKKDKNHNYLKQLNETTDEIKELITECKEGEMRKEDISGIKDYDINGKKIDRIKLYDNILRNLDRATTLNPKTKNPENVEKPEDYDVEEHEKGLEQREKERDERALIERIESKRASYEGAINRFKNKNIKPEIRTFIIKSFGSYVNKNGYENDDLYKSHEKMKNEPDEDDEEELEEYNKRVDKYRKRIKEIIGAIPDNERSQWQKNAYNALIELEKTEKKDKQIKTEDEKEGAKSEKADLEINTTTKKTGMPENELPEIEVKLKKEKPEIIGMLEKDMPDEEEENKLDFLEKGSEKKADDKKAGKVSRKNSLADNNLQNARSARDIIVELRDKGFETRNSSYFTDKVKEDYGNKFLKIIAARQLADSDRNNPERLKTVSITAEQLDQRVAEMKEDAVFKGFIDSIKKSKSKMISAITRATATPGHGGKLDDMLKKYMLNLPPGELKNSKLHERYMPSVDERIEKIKEQVEKLHNKKTTSKKEDAKINDQLVKAVAEIIELRNLSQADYGKKESLAKKVPCDQNVLESKINALAGDKAFRSTALDRNVQKLLMAKGHGGKMTVKVRELYSQNLENQAEISEILEENTIQARMKQMKKKAGEIAKSLGKAQPGSDIQNDQAKAGKELMEEYYLLYAKIVKPETFKVDQNMLKKDVPWGKISELKTKDTVYRNKFRNMIGYFKPEDIADCLDSLSKNKIEDDMTNMNAKISEVSTRIKSEKNAANDQEIAAQGPAQPKAQKKGAKKK